MQAETTWLPVNDNYKEINLESEKMEIYGHWFNMKNLLSLRKSVSGSYPTSMVFCYPNYSDLLWEKIVLVIEKNFWNWRLKAENLQNFWDH